MTADRATLQDLHRHIQVEREDNRGSLFFPLRALGDPRSSETPLMERGGPVEEQYR